MSECHSRLSLSARVEREPEGYTLAVSHGRPGISQQVSGVALPYTERKVNVDILLHMYYKSMPLVFTPVTDAIWLLCIGVRRAKSGPISSAIYLRRFLCSYLVPLQQRLARILDALACDVTF